MLSRMNRTRNTHWVAGSVVSWMLGVTLGVIVGITLLIATPLMMRPAQQTAAAEGRQAGGQEQEGGRETVSGMESPGGEGEGTLGTPQKEGEGATAGGEGAGGDDDSTGMGPEGGEVGNTGTGAARTSNDNQDIATEDAGEDDPARQRSVEAPEGSAAAGPDGTGVQEIGTEHSSGNSTQGSDTGPGTSPDGGKQEQNTPAAPGGTGNAGSGAPAAGDAGAGKTLFASSCGGCHGQNGQGGIGPAMTDDANKWTLAQFTAAVRQGKAPDRELGPAMPRFSKAQLSDADLASIHAYVTSLN